MKESHRQVLLLATAQALFQTVSVIVVTVGSLAGAAMAPAEWATVPMATMLLGTAITTFPASIWMIRVGRTVGFMAGAALGVLGGLIAAGGVLGGSFLLLCLGTLLVGAYQGFAQFYRFAAAEVAEESFRPRAISLVLAGGVVAAFAGPALARMGGPLLEPVYLASFLFIAALSVVAVGMLALVRVPPPSATETDPAGARPLGAIMRQPLYLVALFGAATGAGVMILAMTATPLAMTHHHHGLDATATVIQFHVLGMFLPSFFSGSLVARFGAPKVMLAGVACLTAHVGLALSGTGFYSFASALLLLGVGWNFLYVGGTSLLTATYNTAEKGKAQAANDMTIFVVGLIASLSAGFLHGSMGWQAMNAWLLPWLAVTAAAIVWASRTLSSPGRTVPATPR
jgi:predicted MFS family arabinose efflux permease